MGWETLYSIKKIITPLYCRCYDSTYYWIWIWIGNPWRLMFWLLILIEGQNHNTSTVSQIWNQDLFLQNHPTCRIQWPSRRPSPASCCGRLEPVLILQGAAVILELAKWDFAIQFPEFSWVVWAPIKFRINISQKINSDEALSNIQHMYNKIIIKLCKISILNINWEWVLLLSLVWCSFCKKYVMFFKLDKAQTHRGAIELQVLSATETVVGN